jgi:outer membrane protein assembly factor BamB
MERDQSNLVFVGLKGTVFGLDRDTGQKVWTTPLKGSDLVNLMLEGDRLFATARGEVFCLDPRDGSILWNNGMPGYGWGFVAMATTGMSANAASFIERRRQSQQAATT